MLTAHLDQLLSYCASSTYAFRRHGLQRHAVAPRGSKNNHPCFANVYASPAWWASLLPMTRIEQLINKLKRCGFLPAATPDVAILALEADDRLLRT